MLAYEVKLIVEAQQTRMFAIEDIRESLCKLSKAKRTIEKFSARWDDIVRIFNVCKSEHERLLAANVPRDIAYFANNKFDSISEVCERARRFIEQVHPGLTSTTVFVEGAEGEDKHADRSGAGALATGAVPKQASTNEESQSDLINRAISDGRSTGFAAGSQNSWNDECLPADATITLQQMRQIARDSVDVGNDRENRDKFCLPGDKSERYQPDEDEHIGRKEYGNRNSREFQTTCGIEEKSRSLKTNEQPLYIRFDTAYVGKPSQQNSCVPPREGYRVDYCFPEDSAAQKTYRVTNSQVGDQRENLNYNRSDEPYIFREQPNFAYDRNSYMYRWRPSPPTPEIPKFEGDIRQFESFKNIFNSIYEGFAVGETERLIMLQSKLSGDAKRVIEHLGIDGRNYRHAWDLLNRRYSSRRALVEKEIQAIIDLPQISQDDPKSLGRSIDLVRSVVQNMRKVGIDAGTGVPFIPFVVTRKMDLSTRREFDASLPDPRAPVSLTDVDQFLEKRYIIMTSTDNSDALQYLQTKPVPKRREHTFVAQDGNLTRGEHNSVSSEPINKQRKFRCFICSDEHYTIRCPKLLNAENKEALLRRSKVCIYCVSHKYDHQNPCKKRPSLICDICKENHITLMHPVKKIATDTSSHVCENATETSISSTVLPTAIARVLASNGEPLSVRCLIDQGSQSSYITEDLVQKLRLKKKRTSVEIYGVGGVASEKPSAVVWLKIKLTGECGPVLKTKALVVKRVTRGHLPCLPYKLKWTAKNKDLADPSFQHPSHVPILLGSNILPALFLEGLEKIDGYLFQNTKLGWVVSGPADDNYTTHTSSHVALAEFEQKLLDFWDLPVAYDDNDADTKEFCEKLFVDKHYRQDDGRYVVPVPWRQDAPQLGNSYSMAVQRFLGQERRWQKNPALKTMSDDFMNEYLHLGHMVPVSKADYADVSGHVYYIPYLSVLRTDAITTKLRNVFNASSPSSTGVSLNDCIHPGPTLQTRIFAIISRARQFRYVFWSDITKMYRQIQLLPEDQQRLRILYRQNPDDPINEFCLTTVTYGVDCAPWQAIRTVHQAANDNAPNNDINWIIKNAFYVDDFYYGAQTVNESQQIISDVSSTLEKGRMTLTKWASNCPEVLANVNPQHRLESYLASRQEGQYVKVLGLHYNPTEDCFRYVLKPQSEVTYTKRELLSAAAAIYDPIGWILPVSMKLRMSLQSCWEKGYDWDDMVDPALRNQFNKVLVTLDVLNDIRIPRWIGNSDPSHTTELFGFCDASGDGYAAVIYSRIPSNGEYTVRLIAAKGRVTPLKTKKDAASKPCTIPKLELESVLLLTDLFAEVRQSLGTIPINFTAYTDSEVALSWVRSKKDSENKIVRRRVAKIRKVLSPLDLHHVRSEQNPADCASRGLTPEALLKHHLWFTGPSFLQGALPKTIFSPLQAETMSCMATANAVDEECYPPFIQRFSTWRKLVNTVAVCLRWRNKRRNAYSAYELKEAEIAVIRYQQHEMFSTELQMLGGGKQVAQRHWLSPLSPFVEPESGLLRVGGRLNKSNLPFDKKHPIILGKCYLVELLIRHVHTENTHCGNGLVMAVIRERFYISALQSQVKKVLRNCVLCTKLRAKTVQPVMADLLKERVSPSYVFECVGTDLCGPFQIKSTPLKFAKPLKVYIVVFVCMSTKMIHLELCSDLSTNTYLLAFNRFTSRRGQPSVIRSDNGTNLVGAAKILKEAWISLTAKCEASLAVKGITWLHNPPRASHFGGLFEAAVGSLKRFLKRTSHVSNLTYEEFNTAVCGWEAILNSRPLYPITDTSDNWDVLTPAHFVIQRSLLAPPMGQGLNENRPATKKWLQIRELQHQFWKLFENEYLSHLQKRYKWKGHGRQLQEGEVVILQEDNSVPLNWKLARITEVYPDSKGVVRQVSVKTATRENVQRSVHKLVPLLPEEEARTPSEEQCGISRSQNRKTCNHPMVTRQQTAANNREKSAESRPKIRTSAAHSVTGGLLPNILMLTLCCILLASTTLAMRAATPALRSSTLRNMVNILPINESQAITLQQIQVKALDAKFSILTSVNVTHNRALISTEIRDFDSFCKNQLTNKERLQQLCLSRERALADSFSALEAIINNEFPSRRSKRAPISPALMVLGSEMFKLGAKYLPGLVMTGAVTYFGYKDFVMSQNLEHMKEKTARIAALALNISDLQYHQVDDQLRIVSHQQQDMLLEQQILEVSTALQTIIEEMCLKLNQLEDIAPVEELQLFVSNLTKHLPDLQVPTVIDKQKLFHLSPREKSLNDGLMCLTFTVPLVKIQEFTDTVVISVPDINNMTFIFDNGQPIQRLYISNDGSKYFFREEADEIAPRFYDVRLMRRAPNCALQIATNRSPPYPLCTKKSLTNDITFLRIDEKRGIFTVRPMAASPKLQCDNDTTILPPPAALVSFDNCQMSTVNWTVTGSSHANHHIQWFNISDLVADNIAALNMRVNTVTRSPGDNRLQELKDDFQHEINELLHHHPTRSWWIAGGLVLLIVLVLGWLIRVCCRRRQHHRDTFVSHLSAEDRVMGSWVRPNRGEATIGDSSC